MPSNQGPTVPGNPLARLIGQLPAEPDAAVGTHLWRRLNMESVARRVIQSARVAAAEHTLQRAEEIVQHRDAAIQSRPATA